MATPSIPAVQKAAIIHTPGPNATIRIEDDTPVGSLDTHQVLVKLAYSGLCKSEIRAFLGWGSYQPVVGHEGVGIVVKTGENVTDSMLGQRVGVKWVFSACGECSACQAQTPNHCAKQVNTGLHVRGTLQQYVVADARYLTMIPDGLSSEVACPLLCAGLTMAGAVAKLDGKVPSDGWIVLSGSGGGLGHLGVQIASRLKELKIIAIDSGSKKRELSLQCGAHEFIDFATEDVEQRVKAITGGEGAHACLVVSGSEDAFELAPKLVRNTGLLVFIGLPRATFNIPISASLFSARALTITGVAVGTEKQMEELLERAVAGTISPLIHVKEFDEIPHLFDALRQDEVVGRLVVRIPE
ncbi:Alcohol dehydrogenase 2 [Cladobotryum mycophilum]|uniref:Alcohol dehydrogenase 2 n=1 Tax=Cladobotryum mycophilum TaxID=491253 RepID=A0ABR0S801_9HYPO